MTDQFIEFTVDKHFVRRVRELKTIEVMINMYCAAHQVRCALLHQGHARKDKDCDALGWAAYAAAAPNSWYQASSG